MNKLDEFSKLKRMNGTDKKSKRKRQSYKCAIKAYFKVNGKDIDTYFSRNQTYEQDIRKYWEWVGSKATTTQSSYMAMVKSFLIKFDKKGIKDLDIWDDVSIHLKGKRKPNYEKHVPSHEELQQILNYCDIRTKTAILLSISSGIRMEAVVGLLPSDIEYNYDNTGMTKLYIRPEIAKDGNAYTTFCSPEATKLLKEWQRKREDYVLKSYRTLRFKYAPELIKKFKAGKDQRIIPFHDVPIRDAFNKACEDAGFIGKTKIKDRTDGVKKQFKDRYRRKITFHCLRAFFETYLGDWYLAKKLMGHSLYMSTYDKKPDQLLAKKYAELVNNLAIYERTPDLSEVNAEMKEKTQQIQKLEDKMQRIEDLLNQKEHLLTLYKNQIENGRNIKK